jgi:hypothetical protein
MPSAGIITIATMSPILFIGISIVIVYLYHYLNQMVPCASFYYGCSIDGMVVCSNCEEKCVDENATFMTGSKDELDDEDEPTRPIPRCLFIKYLWNRFLIWKNYDPDEWTGNSRLPFPE